MANYIRLPLLALLVVVAGCDAMVTMDDAKMAEAVCSGNSGLKYFWRPSTAKIAVVCLNRAYVEVPYARKEPANVE